MLICLDMLFFKHKGCGFSVGSRSGFQTGGRGVTGGVTGGPQGCYECFFHCQVQPADGSNFYIYTQTVFHCWHWQVCDWTSN